jgi:formamidopyrimidine-DNA glycosylase
LEESMKATILDLRYRMKDVLKALERNEDVNILYHGKLKGTIRPHKQDAGKQVTDHPFFNMRKGDESVEKMMEHLRGGRYCDL